MVNQCCKGGFQTRPFVLALYILLGAASLYCAEPKAEIFKVGAGKIEITPRVETFSDLNKNGRYDLDEPFVDLNGNEKWDPVWLAGYGGGRYAEGVHDDIWARSLFLEKGKEKVLIVTLDLIGYLFDEVSIVKNLLAAKFGLDPSHILILSTHEHSGPDAIGLWGADGKSGRNPEYLGEVRKKILQCTDAAYKNLTPAQMIFGKIHYSNPIEDSRPPKVINDLLLSFRAVDEKGATVATFVNYAMHAEVLDGDNRRITADYPGVLRDELEKHYGGIAFFSAADLGGMQSPFVLFHSFWSCRRVGKSIAEKVIESFENQKSAAVSLSVKSKSVEFPIENQKFLGAIQAGLFGDASRYAKKSDGQVFLPSDLSVIRLGPAVIVTVPGEAFPELGNVLRSQIKSEYPFLLGLCNNEIGYIMPREEWHDGGYEETMSLGPKTAELLVQFLTPLLAP